MWYEILPSLTIIFTAMSIPNLFVYVTNNLYVGQSFKRSLCSNFAIYEFMRDMRISPRSWPYDFLGLDNIPDLESERVEQETEESEVVCYVRKKPKPAPA